MISEVPPNPSHSAITWFKGEVHFCADERFIHPLLLVDAVLTGL